MLVIKSIVASLRLFQLFGLSPFSMNTKNFIPTSNKLFNFYSITLILMHAVILLHGLCTTQSFIRKGELRIIATIDIVMMCGIRFLTLLIVVESFVKRIKQIAFFQHLNEIDEIFTIKLGIDMEYRQLRRNTITKLFIWAACLTIIELAIFLMEMNDKDYLYFCLLYLFPLFVATLHYFQVITYVNLIKFRFQQLNGILNAMDLEGHFKGNILFSIKFRCLLL